MNGKTSWGKSVWAGFGLTSKLMSHSNMWVSTRYKLYFSWDCPHTHTHTRPKAGLFFEKLVARMDQPVVPIASGTKSNRHLPCYKANNVTVKKDSSTWWGPAPLYPCSPTSWGGSWEQLEEQLGRRSIRLLAEILPHVALSMFLQVFNGQSS